MNVILIKLFKFNEITFYYFDRSGVQKVNFNFFANILSYETGENSINYCIRDVLKLIKCQINIIKHDDSINVFKLIKHKR